MRGRIDNDDIYWLACLNIPKQAFWGWGYCNLCSTLIDVFDGKCKLLNEINA